MKTLSFSRLKKILFGFFILTFMTISAQEYVQNVNVINGRTQYKYSDSFTNYEVQVKGNIKVNGDDTGILSISPGGSLKISKKTFGNKRSIIIESNSAGEMNYEYFEGRREVPYDPEGKKWLADVLLDVVRITGIDARGRTKRLYKKGGINAFVEEIHAISSNSIRGIYFEALLDHFDLDEEELVTVTAVISKEISSNTERGRLYRKYSNLFMVNNTVAVAYFNGISKLSSNTERGSVLRKISKEIDFNYPKVTEAYFACIDKMSINTERGSVLRNAERTQKLSENAYERLLVSVKKISSNTEMGSVMRSLENLNMHNTGIATSYFNAIDGMSSNTEAGSTLRHLIKHYDLNDDNYVRLLGCVKKLSSNTEMGSVMRSIQTINLSNSSVNEAYFLSINSMTSNTEAGTVLRYTIKNYELNQDSWTTLLMATSKLSSNTEMGLVLRTAIPKMPFNQHEVDAFLTATGHIASNTEKSSVLMDMAKSSKLDKYACIGLLESARRLSSNTEKSKVLRAVADTDFIKNDEVKSTYMAVAKTLSSDTEYRRVVEKLIN